MWDQLSDYEVRHILYHLAASGKQTYYQRLVSNCSFIEAFLSRNSLAAFIESLEAATACLPAASEACRLTRNLLQVLLTDAGSLDDWARKESRYSLYNQLLNAALLSGTDLPLISSWNKQAAYQVDVGIRWHDYHNQVIRIIMPGIRRSFGWDSYDAGWMGTRTQVWVNLEENRFYTETISTYHHGFSDYSLYICRSEYALGMCTLLQAYPEVVVRGDNTNTSRPESFRKVQEQEEIKLIKFENQELAELIKKRFLKRFKRFKDIFVRVIAFSLNDQEAMFSVSVKQIGTNAFKTEPFYFLFGIDTHTITETDLSTAFVYESYILKLFRQQEQRFVFVQGPGQDLLKVRVQPRTPHQPAGESILNACLDPENRFLVFCRHSQLEIRQVQTGKLLHKLPYEQEIGLPSDLSLAANSSSFIVASDKLVKQYAYTGQTEQIILAPLPRGPLLFLSSFDSYIYQREVLAVETGQVRYRMEPGAIETVPSYTSVQTGLSFRESYFFEKSEYLISVWHAATGRPFTALEATTDHYGDTGFLVGWAVSPDERFVISARDGRQVVVWDLSLPGAFRALPHWTLNGLEGVTGIRELAFFNGGYWVALLTDDQQLYICSFESDSRILSSIRLPQMPQKLLAPAYGKSIIAVFAGGSLVCYHVQEFYNTGKTEVRGRQVCFRFHAPQAASVALVASFQQWQPLAMHPDEAGTWTCGINLPPGRHEYKFFIDNARWELDPGTGFIPGPLDKNSYIDIVE